MSTDQQAEVRSAAAALADDLYRSLSPFLRHMAMKKFRVPRAEAETLVHDVFATYFGRASAVHDPRRYLIGAMCNAARHYWREQGQESAGALALHHPLPAVEGVDEALGRKALVAAALSRVGAKCRELLRSYYLEEETTAEIARRRNSTPGSILVQLHNCRKCARDIVRALLKGS